MTYWLSRSQSERSFSFLILPLLSAGSVSFFSQFLWHHSYSWCSSSLFTTFWFRLPLLCKTSKLWHVWGLGPQSQSSYIYTVFLGNFPGTYGFKYCLYIREPQICTSGSDLAQKLQSHVSNILPAIFIRKSTRHLKIKMPTKLKWSQPYTWP